MSKKKMKREDFPAIQITLTAYNTRPSKESNGHGLLTMLVDNTRVSDSETGEELGSIGSGLGNLVIDTKKGYYMISHKDIWNAVAEYEQHNEN